MRKIIKTDSGFLLTAFIALLFIILVCENVAAAENPLKNFIKIVENDSGLSSEEKKEWRTLAHGKFKGRQFAADHSRLVYGILCMAKFDEVDMEKGIQVALDSAIAVDAGANQEAVSDLAHFAFSVTLSPEEVSLYAGIREKCVKAGVPVHVVQEMIIKAKAAKWPDTMTAAIMNGLVEAAEHGSDTQKVALFMLISIEQELGTPEEIVRDAIDNAKKREPEKWQEPQDEKSFAAVENSAMQSLRVRLNYNTFHQSVTSFLGTPYRWGGNGRAGVDCSGFTKLVMQENGYRIPRVSYQQAAIGTPVSKDEFKLGDLVFFDIKGRGKIDHVGLYLGGNLLAHASSKKGVTIVMFSERYYQSRFYCGRRIVKYQR